MPLACGLLPLSQEQQEEHRRVCAAAPKYQIEYGWANDGDMPILAWSSDFEKKLASRSKLREEYENAGMSLYPWDIYAALPEDVKKSSVLCWNQGSLPSCSMHGAAHAFQAAELISIGLGSPLIYDAVNPIYSFYRGRGGNLYGGLDLLTTSKEINETGFYPVSAVGKNNTSVDRDNLSKTDEASKHQAGIIRIENNLVDKIFDACKGLCAIMFGASMFYSSATTDRNGVRVMSSTSGGGHAQAFYGYKNVNGTEYIFNQNSHGDIYGNPSNPNEPKSGAWITKDHLERYTGSMLSYGAPMIIFAEAEHNEGSLVNAVNVPQLRQ